MNHSQLVELVNYITTLDINITQSKIASIEAPKTKRIRVRTNVSNKDTESFILAYCETGKAFTSTDIAIAFAEEFGMELEGRAEHTIKQKIYGRIKSLQDKNLLQRVGRIEGTPSYLYRSTTRNRNQQLTVTL